MRLIDIEDIDYVRLEDSLHCLEHHKGDEVECVICAPTVEAIPKDQYEQRLKADLKAMLEDLQLEIVEHEESIIGPYSKETKESDFPLHKIERNNGRKECIDLIQQKINALRGGENEGNA